MRGKGSMPPPSGPALPSDSAPLPATRPSVPAKSEDGVPARALLAPKPPSIADPPNVPETPSPSAKWVAALSDSKPPLPTPEGYMSTAAKMSLAEMALALRDEQLEAKVVHYKGELATNPELDAVTAQVIQELQNIQAAGRSSQGNLSRPPPAADRTHVEIELIRTLKEMLSRVFRRGKLATVIERKLSEVSKRFARLFFESELHEKIRGSNDEVRTIDFPEQALFYAFTRLRDDVYRHLEEFQYASPQSRLRAREQFDTMQRALRNDFLARTTPELNVLVKFLNEVLTTFFISELPPLVGDLAWEVVKEARLADARMSASCKISASAFSPFRQAFERRFLERLVPFVEDEMLRRVRSEDRSFRAETIRLVADPAIFSDVCEVVCDAVYDILYNDGFLDLPSDWRVRLSARP